MFEQKLLSIAKSRFSYTYFGKGRQNGTVGKRAISVFAPHLTFSLVCQKDEKRAKYDEHTNSGEVVWAKQQHSNPMKSHRNNGAVLDKWIFFIAKYKSFASNGSVHVPRKSFTHTLSVFVCSLHWNIHTVFGYQKHDHVESIAMSKICQKCDFVRAEERKRKILELTVRMSNKRHFAAIGNDYISQILITLTEAIWPYGRYKCLTHIIPFL